jgi:uncharacterized protein YndB with AHSA1/START domain
MTDTTNRGTSVVGTLRAIDGVRGAIRMEDTFDTDIDDLWSALTDRERLARWIASVDGELRVGGRIHARFTSSSEGSGRVDVCDGPGRLMVTMEPGTAAETVIEALLTPVGEQTRLVIEERGRSLDKLADHGAGWQAHVEDLAAHVAGLEPGDWQARWIELTPTYQGFARSL